MHFLYLSLKITKAPPETPGKIAISFTYVERLSQINPSGLRVNVEVVDI